VAYVFVVDELSLPALLGVRSVSALAASGGAALMNGRSDVRRELRTLSDPGPDDRVSRAPMGLVIEEMGSVAPDDLDRVLVDLDAAVESAPLVMVISESPSAATAADGDELGTVIAAWGDPDELVETQGEPHALTSDSTRRHGVVASEDPSATVAAWLDLPYEGSGAPIERTGEPAPLDLYRRYLQQRRLAVPVAAAAWGVVTAAGLAGVLVLAFRRRLSDRVLAAAAALAASLPWLALGLLLVGHLPSLTYATVIPFLLALVVGGVAFSRWVASKRGVFAAVAASGAVILAALAIEAALGWPAAVTPLAGGGQLDGGRFFGMPNIEIGLVLGSSLYAAQRIGVMAGFGLLVAAGVVAGSPWTGSNFGAAVTLFATAGIWLGMRRRRRWWAIGLLTITTTAIGMAVISLMHRYLSERPTHVTAFFERATGMSGALDTLVDRLGIGVDMLADTPFALIPVLGTLVLLVVVLRPPASIARSFEGHDAWRDAVLAIVLGSIIAYLANDTGAAALGFGFGTALSGLLFVSLTSAGGMMAR
jgi:hypothetical protein